MRGVGGWSGVGPKIFRHAQDLQPPHPPPALTKHTELHSLQEWWWAFLTTVKEAYFIERCGEHTYAVTPAIYSSSTNPSQREMLFCKCLSFLPETVQALFVGSSIDACLRKTPSTSASVQSEQSYNRAPAC